MKNNKNLLVILGVAVVAVWGTVGYRIYYEYSSIDDVDISKTVAIEKSGFNRYEYKRDVRDPFDIFPNPNKKQTLIPVLNGNKNDNKWMPPPYNLNGVIIDKERKIAILEGVDGVTSFLSERDSLNGIVILHIESSQVDYSYRGKKQMWRID